MQPRQILTNHQIIQNALEQHIMHLWITGTNSHGRSVSFLHLFDYPDDFHAWLKTNVLPQPLHWGLTNDDANRLAALANAYTQFRINGD